MRTIGSILITLALAAQVAASDLVITNARVVGEAETVHVVVRGGTIRAIGRQVRAPRSAPQVDAKGAWLLPGRIDAWATLPELAWGSEMFGPLLLKDDIVAEPLAYGEFGVALPKGPGLGVTLDEDKLAHFTRKP